MEKDDINYYVRYNKLYPDGNLADVDLNVQGHCSIIKTKLGLFEFDFVNLSKEDIKKIFSKFIEELYEGGYGMSADDIISCIPHIEANPRFWDKVQFVDKGDRIKKIREQRWMTRKELAQKVGLSDKYGEQRIKNIEENIEPLSRYMTLKIAKALDVPHPMIVETFFIDKEDFKWKN